jgi:hypothetical protein
MFAETERGTAMQESKTRSDIRFIEAGFPCHQVGAETQRERDTGKAPPTHRLHVWWARRPLTASRAAILGSLLPAGTDPDWFLRQLGIEKVQAIVNGEPWTLEDKLVERIEKDATGQERLKVDSVVERALLREQGLREGYRKQIEDIVSVNSSLSEHPVIQKWRELSKPLPEPLSLEGRALFIKRIAADPAWFKELLEIAGSVGVRVPNLYGYSRAFMHHPDCCQSSEITVLDCTAGGGSIPFEALRLGHRVIGNDLNPVATVILYATLDYPARYGLTLIDVPLIFVPDQNLGKWVQRKTGRKMVLWEGYCPSHHDLSVEAVQQVKDQHPEAEVLVHPECRPEVINLADGVFSTAGIIEYVGKSSNNSFIIGTEQGILYQLQTRYPEKAFYLASPVLLCENMKSIDLFKLKRALQTLTPRVTVPPAVSKAATLALNRMLALG